MPAAILYNGGCNFGPDKVVFDGGTIERIRIHALDPKTAGLEINNMTIHQQNLYMVHLERTCFGAYHDITISNNSFTSAGIPGGAPGGWDPDYGIRVENFNAN